LISKNDLPEETTPITIRPGSKPRYLDHGEMVSVFTAGGRILATIKFGVRSAAYEIMMGKATYLHSCTDRSCGHLQDPQNLS